MRLLQCQRCIVPMTDQSFKTMNDKRVLIIDDDVDLLQLAGVLFKKAGAEIVTARDGVEGISKLFTHRPDLIVLDVMMPGMDGFEVCRRIRQVSDTPLIMLTALNHEREMLMGLEAGADDFLAKPFNADILLARTRTVLRRAQHQNNGNNDDSFKYNDGHLVIDIERHMVLVKGRRVKLSPLEFRLLVYLARNGGKLLTFDRILSNAWGEEYMGNIGYVHIYISRLRKKIEITPKNPRYILTVHGVGYIFEKPELEYKS